MAHASITLDGQDRDGDFVEQLHTLQAQRQAGAITAEEFDAAFRTLDRAAGTLCGCQRGIRTVKSAVGDVCATCWLEGRR